MRETVWLRGGYAHEGALSENRVTWGLGFENEAGAVEYAMVVPIEDRYDLGFGRVLHTVSIRVHPPDDPIEEPTGFGGGRGPFGM